MSINHVTLYVKSGHDVFLGLTDSLANKDKLKIKIGEKEAKPIERGISDSNFTINKVIQACFDIIKDVGGKKERLKFDILGENSRFDLAIKILPSEAAKKAQEGKLNFLTSFFWAPITIEDEKGNKQTFLVNRSSAEKRLCQLGFTKVEVQAWLKSGKLNDSFFDKLLSKDLEKKVQARFSGYCSVMKSEDQNKLINKLESWVKSGEVLEEEIDTLLKNHSFNKKTGEILFYPTTHQYFGATYPVYQEIYSYEEDKLENAKDYTHFLTALKNKENEGMLQNRSFLDKIHYVNNGKAFLDILLIRDKNKMPQNAFSREKQIQQFEEALEIYLKEQEQFKEETKLEKNKKNEQLFLDLYRDKMANTFTHYGKGLENYTQNANEKAAIEKAERIRKEEISKQKVASLASIDKFLKNAPLEFIQQVEQFCKSKSEESGGMNP